MTEVPASEYTVAGYQSRRVRLKAIGYPSYPAYLRSDLWASIRQRVLERDQHQCVLCRLKGRNTKTATQVHHLIYTTPVLLGHQLERLVSLCGGCHRRIELFRGDKKTRLNSWRSFASMSGAAELAISPYYGWVAIPNRECRKCGQGKELVFGECQVWKSNPEQKIKDRHPHIVQYLVCNACRTIVGRIERPQSGWDGGTDQPWPELFETQTDIRTWRIPNDVIWREPTEEELLQQRQEHEKEEQKRKEREDKELIVDAERLRYAVLDCLRHAPRGTTTICIVNAIHRGTAPSDGNPIIPDQYVKPPVVGGAIHYPLHKPNRRDTEEVLKGFVEKGIVKQVRVPRPEGKRPGWKLVRTPKTKLDSTAQELLANIAAAKEQQGVTAERQVKSPPPSPQKPQKHRKQDYDPCREGLIVQIDHGILMCMACGWTWRGQWLPWLKPEDCTNCGGLGDE